MPKIFLGPENNSCQSRKLVTVETKNMDFGVIPTSLILDKVAIHGNFYHTGQFKTDFPYQF